MNEFFFEVSVLSNNAQNGFLKFYVVSILNNLPFQPYYCPPHGVRFQKMHIIWAVQFSPKKLSSSELCTMIWIYDNNCLFANNYTHKCVQPVLFPIYLHSPIHHCLFSCHHIHLSGFSFSSLMKIGQLGTRDICIKIGNLTSNKINTFLEIVFHYS